MKLPKNKNLLKCHCQSIEIELYLPNGFENLEDVIVRFVADEMQ